jgi:hypothetical protein
METIMRPLNILAATAIATLVGIASLTGARAMPIALPSAAATAQNAFSGEAVAPRSGLIQEAGWHRHGWHRDGWHRHGWHARRWHHHWH